MVNRSGEVIPAPDADLCLAFANTRYWRGTATPADELNGLDDLLRWTEKAERLPPAMVQRFAAHTAIFQDAIALRETIHRCFAATASGGAHPAAELAALNAALEQAPARRRVQAGGWDVGMPGPSAAALLAPALWSAADLLVGAQLGRVRQCANPAVRLAVPRQQQERQPALVLDERLRQPRQGASALPAAEAELSAGPGESGERPGIPVRGGRASKVPHGDHGEPPSATEIAMRFARSAISLLGGSQWL